MPDEKEKDERLKDPAQPDANKPLKQPQPLWGWKGVPFDAETQEHLNDLEARDWARKR